MALTRNLISEGRDKVSDMSSQISEIESAINSINSAKSSNDDYGKFVSGTNTGSNLDQALSALFTQTNSSCEVLSSLLTKATNFLNTQESLNEKSSF